MPKIRNILIFVGIAAALFMVYFFFIKPSSSGSADLVSSASTAALPSGNSSGTGTSPVGQDFLSLLLNVNNIKLDDSILSDPAFANLHDSSITLVPDAVVGRPNPFAQFGANAVSIPANSSSAPIIPTTTPTTPIAPATPTGIPASPKP
ncbi:MAG: hypothetical protein WAN61_00790 [Minisyncoccia bacterium]